MCFCCLEWHTWPNMCFVGVIILLKLAKLHLETSISLQKTEESWHNAIKFTRQVYLHIEYYCGIGMC